MIRDKLDQIPAIAVQVHEHRDGAVRLLARRAHEADARLAVMAR